MKNSCPRASFVLVTTVLIACLLGLACGSHSGDVPESDFQSPLWVDGARAIGADSEPQNWLAHGRDYAEQRHSPLESIDTSNVSRLGLAWSFETGAERGHEATPIVVDGVMFLTAPWSVVHALNAKTGKLLWTHDPQVPRAWGRRASLSRRAVS